ncbi:tetratricopeptide repeat protein [Carboxylicivirga sp. N1Y90]|uniref:tetratricopeptide repeat protein n=1 Tax=Carboxylicivirga fragile TaxID=3417571 RepID=UPI003D340A35|nr:tetratricopeptide repeat protein [Marinilabiliaceae bacterium N1Y90]
MILHFKNLSKLSIYSLLIIFYWNSLTELQAVSTASLDTVLINIMNEKDPLIKTHKLTNWAFKTQKNQLKESSKLFDLAYNLAEEHNFLREMTTAKYGLAKNFEFNMNYQQALKCYKEYGELAKQLNDSNDIAIALHYQGEMHYSLGDYEKSEQCYLQAIEVSEEAGLNNHIAACYNNIGLIYYHSDWAKALKYYKKGLNIRLAHNDTVNAVILMNNIACIYMNNDSLDKAKDLLTEALDIAEKNNDYQALTLIYASMAGYKELSGQEHEVQEWYYKAYDLYEEYDFLKDRTNLLQLMHSFFYFNEEYDKAYNYLFEFVELKDSLNLANNEREFLKQEFNDEMQKINYQRKLDNVEHEQKMLRYRILLGFCIAFLFLIISTMIVRRRVNRKRLILVKENQELKEKLLLETVGQKNNELTSKALLLNERNELIKSVVEKLNNCKANLKKSNVEPIQNVIDSLDAGLNERQWKEFEDSFNSVHPDFNNKLIQKYPNLSASDLKLCALLKLNMSSKEISQLTHMTISSVDVARSRIRKKLNIRDQKISLIVFLSEL